MNESGYQSLLGAYVCRILDDEERVLVDAHLRGCAECRQEVVELTEVTRRLDELRGGAEVTEASSASPDGLDLVELEAEGARLDSDLILPRTLQALRAQRSRTRRLRLLAAACAVGVLLVGGGVAGAVLGSHTRTPAASPVAPGARTLSAHDAISGVSIVATVTPERGFSRLTALITNEPGNVRCQLIVISRSGEQEVASSWAVGPAGSGSTGTRVTGSAAIPLSEVQQLQVRTLNGTHIVTLPV